MLLQSGYLWAYVLNSERPTVTFSSGYPTRGFIKKKYISLHLIVSKESINNIYFTRNNPILFGFHTAYVCYTHSRYSQDSRVSNYGLEKMD